MLGGAPPAANANVSFMYVAIDRSVASYYECCWRPVAGGVAKLRAV